MLKNNKRANTADEPSHLDLQMRQLIISSGSTVFADLVAIVVFGAKG